MLRVLGMLEVVVDLLVFEGIADDDAKADVAVVALRRRAGSLECRGHKCHCIPHGHRQSRTKRLRLHRLHHVR